MFQLRSQTKPNWIDGILANFDDFLVDHAACERKASATGISFVVRYPDRTKLLEPMIAFAREELEHFHQVYRLIEARGLSLTADVPDPYVTQLMKHVRTGRNERLLDRLILGAVVEARGCERFGIIATSLTDPDLAAFYQEITRSESRHHGLFIRLAKHYFSHEEIQNRLGEFLDFEAEIIERLPMRASLH